MSTLIYISRSFVEFGGFTASEILDFEKRGVIGEHDFVSVHDTKHWVPLKEWIKNESKAASPKGAEAKVVADLKAPEEKAEPIKEKPAAKEKAAPAKKAAAKKAKK